MTQIHFTTSWDDGHPADMRVAEILSKYGCPGTFYVPCRNHQGRPVLEPEELRSLDREHEIGSHTLDHRYLDRVSDTEAQRQIVEGRKILEDCLGHSVLGFAYPGGKHNRDIRQHVRKAGFIYARTIESFALELSPDPFLMPTTMQIYPHKPSSYIRNFTKRGRWFSRFPTLLLALQEQDLPSRLSRLVDRACKRDGVLHLWGHSWEVAELNYWSMLEDLLKQVIERIPQEARRTNRSLQETRNSVGFYDNRASSRCATTIPPK